MTVEIGDVVQGRVVRLRAYGAFVELDNGEVGLVHISEIAEEFVRSVSDYLREGDEVTVKVLGRNEENKLNLSIKRVRPEDVEAMRFEASLAQVQRDLSEREKILPNVQLDIPRPPQALPERPFTIWMRRARAALERIERERLKRKQGPAPQRGRRPHRPSR